MPNAVPQHTASRAPLRQTLVLWLCLIIITPTLCAAQNARDRISLDDCPPDLIRLYLSLAQYSSLAYKTPERELAVSPGGCVAMVLQDYENNLIIAFRGSVIPDEYARQNPDSPHGVVMRLRAIQDWLETNLTQFFGQMPVQYIEAADLAVQVILRHPNANRIFITGHSKGGGQAEFATAAAWLATDIPPQVKSRIMGVTFNAAVVREMNWQRLYDFADDPLVDHYLQGNTPRVDAVIMRDDIVPKMSSIERHPPPFLNLVVIEPITDRWPADQHSLSVVIEELEKRLSGAHSPHWQRRQR